MKSFGIAFLSVTLAGCSLGSSASDRALDAAEVALRLGNFQEAKAQVRRGLDAASSGDAIEQKLRLLEVEILITERSIPDALALLEKVSVTNGSGELTGKPAYLRARASIAGGRQREALELLTEARESTPAAAGDIRRDIDILEGQIRLQQRDWDRGETILQSVVERAVTAGDRYREAVAYGNLGVSRFVRNRHEEALFWFEKVLAFAEFEGYTVYAAALTNAATCYTRLGQFDRALAAHSRALIVHEKRGASSNLAIALSQVGVLHVLQERAREALPYLQRAFDVARDAHLKPLADAQAGNLAEVHQMLQQWDEAERFNELQRDTATNDPARTAYYTGTAARIALGRGDLDRAAVLFDETLHHAVAPWSRWDARAGLAEVALRKGQPSTAARQFELALRTIEETRSDLLRTDNRLSFLTQLIGFYRSYVDMLLDTGDVEKALIVADSSRGRILAERHGTDAGARVAATALEAAVKGRDRTWISYWVTPERSYAWVINEAGVHVATLPALPAIESLVRRHRSEVESGLADVRSDDSAASRLYDELIEPIRRWLPPRGAVIVVPDGPLHAINFETLAARGQDGSRHFWIEDVEIEVAPSLAILTTPAAAPPRAPTPEASANSPSLSRPALLLVGNADAQGPEFPRLRFAAAEMSAITTHFAPESVSLIEGPHAAPQTYREAGPERFSMIHFTAHATANVDSPLDSAVILSGPPDRFRLTARDVAEQKLNAELVTVSACRSAGERAYSGEGLIGFAWAFLRAGSKRVVAGLWDVDDRSTAQLMDSFYARLANGVRPAQALREAKLDLIRSGVTKPYYWGPLQMFTIVP